jgi:hypothetical protein
VSSGRGVLPMWVIPMWVIVVGRALLMAAARGWVLLLALRNRWAWPWP